MGLCHGIFTEISNGGLLSANNVCQNEMREALDRQMLFAIRSIPQLNPGP